MLGIALLLVAYFEMRPNSPHGPGPAMRDFEAFYAAGLTVNRGADPYGRAIWSAEKTIPGVDLSHDETLPFVGPPSGLPLWRALARFPYDVAGRIWGAALAIAMLVVIFGSLALARAPRITSVLLGATILTAAFGALISDVSLGQVALVSAASIVAILLLLPTRAWLLAALAAVSAALVPNLALVLLARLTDARALIAFAIGAAGFAALMLPQGIESVPRYLHLLSVHGAAEAGTVIQITPAAIALALGANATTIARVLFSLLAIALTIFALRRIAEPAMRVGIASCALPFAVPFIHEHDFVLLLLPSIICATRAHSATLAFAAVAATAAGIDWLGLAQRPQNDPQTIVLSIASGLGFVLVARLRPQAFAALAVPLAVVAISVLARAHPVPIWPNALPPHWQPPPGASVSEIWGMEQRAAGLDAVDPFWDLLRALSLASCALLGFATYLTGKIAALLPANSLARELSFLMFRTESSFLGDSHRGDAASPAELDT